MTSAHVEVDKLSSPIVILGKLIIVMQFGWSRAATADANDHLYVVVDADFDIKRLEKPWECWMLWKTCAFIVVVIIIVFVDTSPSSGPTRIHDIHIFKFA